MARFNETSTGTKTVNLAGGQAYKETAELELASLLLTSFANDQFYEKADTKFNRIDDLLTKVDPLFSAKAGIYARTQYGMRSISHVLACKLAKFISGKDWARRFYSKIVYRPDDMTEIVSYLKADKQKLPSALKRGFADAFKKFDAYQIAKYKGEGKKVKLIDVANLITGKKTDALKNEAVSKLSRGTLTSPETWNAKLTKAGQTAKDAGELVELKKQTWVEFVNNPKLEYFALLRNLRNILQDSPDAIDKACEELVNEKRIKKSLVLPFRFFTAIKELELVSGSRNVIIALSKAAEISLSNVPNFSGNTLIAVDISGSMNGRVRDIAAMFAAVMYKAMNSELIVFNNSAKYVTLNPLDSVLSLAKQIPGTSGGTNFNAIFDSCKTKVSRVIILSDMQAWMTGEYNSNVPTASLNAYKSRTGADPFIYSFDLAGNGSLQFPERNIYCLAGFSEKVFDIMKLLEEDKNALVNKIKEIVI